MLLHPGASSFQSFSTTESPGSNVYRDCSGASSDLYLTSSNLQCPEQRPSMAKAVISVNPTYDSVKECCQTEYEDSFDLGDEGDRETI